MSCKNAENGCACGMEMPAKLPQNRYAEGAHDCLLRVLMRAPAPLPLPPRLPRQAFSA